MTIDEELILPPAVDTSGVPVNPPAEGFQTLGQVEGTATSNAYLAELEAERLRNMDVRTRIALANQAQKAEEQAMKFAGQQEYQQLISGGATPEEALRRTAHKIFYNSPAGLTSAIRATRPQEEFVPKVTPIEGGRTIQLGPQRFQYEPDRAPVMPPEVKAQQDILKGRLRALQTGPMGPFADKAAVADLERQIVEGSTNWMSRPNIPASAPISPTAARNLTRELAADFLKQAKGDKAKARQMARDAGYSF